MIRCFNCQNKVAASERVCPYCGKDPWDMLAVEDYAIKDGVLLKYNSLDSEANVPDGISRIDVMAFESMPVSGVVLPEGVTVIDNHAFYSCMKLVYVYIPSTVKRIGEYAFAECPNLRTITVPKGCRVAKNAFDEHTKVIRE